MSTVGLRKDGNYEDTLAAAIKDEQNVQGVINPYLSNAATKIINNPLLNNNPVFTFTGFYWIFNRIHWIKLDYYWIL